MTTPDDPEATLGSDSPEDLEEQAVGARLQVEMFGADLEPVRVGRFALLKRIGAGAMGVVHAAYDETLDRRVAIKLIRPERAESDEARERLLREARAMARITHHNVVQVYEAGQSRGQLFIAMEFVHGQSLHEWIAAQQRGWREVLELFVAIGSALAVAHEAGVVHRDFKPDNVLLDGSGVPKVADFGLAGLDRMGELERADAQDNDVEDVTLTKTGALLGTPMYMSPEQYLGALADARSDQFSFCVALWVALYRSRPFEGDTLASLSESVLAGRRASIPRDSRVPRRVRQAVERGLSREPLQRWPSMRDLVEALEQGSKRRGRTWIGVALGTLILTGAFAWPYYDRQRHTQACREAAEDEIVAIWNDATRASVRQGLLATRLPYASTTADNTLPWIDEYAVIWREARTESCLDANVRDVWNRETLDRSLWCLDKRLVGLQTLVDGLATADGRVASEAVTAAAGLARVRPCRDAELLQRLPTPPESATRPAVRDVLAKLSRATVLETASRSEEGLALAEDAVAQAETLDLPSVSAASQASLGFVLEAKGAYAQAEVVLEKAYFDAAEVGDLETALRTAVRLIFVVGGRLARREEGRRWGRLAEVILTQMRAPQDDFRRANYLHNLGMVLTRSVRDRGEARNLHEQALAIREAVLGPDHPDVALSLGQLGYIEMLSFNYGEAKRLRAREATVLENALGPDHPAVANSLQGLGMVHKRLGEYEEARSVLERSLAITESILGADHPELVDTLISLANVHKDNGELQTAEQVYRRALANVEGSLGGEHPYVAQISMGLGDVHRAVQSFEPAQAAYERALRIREKAFGPNDSRVGNCLGALANIHRETGDYAQARRFGERAVEVQHSALGPNHPRVADALRDTALVHGEVGDSSREQAGLERALAIYEEFADNHGVRSTLGDLGRAYLRGGDHEQAATYLRRAVSMYERAHGADRRNLAHVLSSLARVHRIEDERAEAIALAERALEIVETAYGPEHLEVADVLDGLVELRLDATRVDEARVLAQRALSIRMGHLDASHPRIAQSLATAARVSLAAGDRAHAVAGLERAAAIFAGCDGVQPGELEVQRLLADSTPGRVPHFAK